MDRSTRTPQSTPRCSQRRGTRSVEGHRQEVDLDNANGASPHHVCRPRPPLMDLSSQMNSTPLRIRSRETDVNSSIVIMPLQNQQQLIQKLLSQQENMQQKQQEFEEKLVQFQTKFDSAVSSSSASSTENMGKRVTQDLTVSEIH